MSEPWKSYELIFGDGALAGIYEEVPRAYFDCIFAALDELRSDPTAKAVRCAHPYPGTKQYDFECRHGERGFCFRVFFIFEPGETRIRVFDLTAVVSW